MVKLLDTSGKNETDAIVTDNDRDTNTDTKPSYAKEHSVKIENLLLLTANKKD